jgi:hypothetical protein
MAKEAVDRGNPQCDYHKKRRTRLMLSRFLINTAVLLSSCAVHVSVSAQRKDDDVAKDLLTSGGKLGISMIKGVIQSRSAPVYVAPPNRGEAGRSLEKVVNDYNRNKARINGQITIEQAVVERLADITAVTAVAATKGAGTVPVALARAVVQAGTDDYFSSKRANAEAAMLQFLKRNQANILTDTGLGYDQLRERSPSEIKAALDSGFKTFSELENTVTDPSVKSFAKDLLVNSLVNTSKASLDQIAVNSDSLSSLSQQVSSLAIATDKIGALTIKALEQQSSAVLELGAAVEDLSSKMAAVDMTLAQQAQGLGVVQDYVFSRMTPAEKASLLRTGTLDARLACPASGACEIGRLREQLVAQYEAEANVQDKINTATQVVALAGGLVGIANELGVETGDAEEIIGYGALALNTVASIASGNYVGAVMGLVGAFSDKGPDPMMTYLQVRFDAIEKKLDRLLDGQKRLEQQISALSARIDARFDVMDYKLDTIQSGIQRVRQLQGASLNEKWRGCYTLFNRAVTSNSAAQYGFDPDTSRFADLQKAMAFWQMNKSTASSCSDAVDGGSLPLSAADWFGSDLSPGRDVAINDPDIAAIEKDREALWRLVNRHAEQLKIPQWQIFRTYASPSSRIQDLRRRLEAPSSSSDPCDRSSGPLQLDRLRSLLCEGTPANGIDPNKSASRALSQAMLPSRALNIAGWMMLEQELADFNTGNDTSSLEAYLRDLMLKPGILRAEEHTEKALLLIDAAIANTAMAYGDFTVIAVGEAIKVTNCYFGCSPVISAPERNTIEGYIKIVLDNHPILARNVATYLLREKAPPAGHYRGISSALSSDMSKRESPGGIGGGLGGPLSELLFLYRDVFWVDYSEDRSDVTIQLRAGGERMSIPRGPGYDKREIEYPNELRLLGRIREMIGLRLLDYRSLRNLSEGERRALIRTLIRSEAAQSKQTGASGGPQ